MELANKKLTPETVKNPLFVVANYVFSNLRNDAIRIENSSVLRGLLSLLCPQDNPDMVNIIPHLQSFHVSSVMIRFIWKYAELSDADLNQYDPDLQTVIQRYRTEIPVSLPIRI